MKKILATSNEFNSNPYWYNSLSDEAVLLDENALHLFDQNGYHLTQVEQAYAMANNCETVMRRHENVIRQNWITMTGFRVGSHFNHSDLFERKAYAGDALEQLRKIAHLNPMLWKVIRMKPKWGIDISIDYVDFEGNVFEVFHYEWDGFEHEAVAEKKEEIQSLILNTDWDNAAHVLMERWDEWSHLDFFEQSRWKTNFFGVSPEKFKNIIWDQRITLRPKQCWKIQF